MISFKPFRMILLVLLVAGCSELKEKPKLAEGKQRWNQMRGRVKLQLATKSFAKGQMDKALDGCREAVGLNPESVEGFVLMTRICLEKGHVATAQAALARAEALADKSAEVHYLKGVVAERRGELVEAADAYALACDLDPQNLDYVLSYAQNLISLDFLDQAELVLAPRVADFEQDPALQALLGQTLFLAGRFDEAAELLTVALDAEPSDDLLREETWIALLAADKIDEAMGTLKPLLKSEKTTPSAGLLRKVAVALIEHDQSAKAVEVLDSAVKTHIDDAQLWRLLARACLDTHDVRGAARAVARVVALDGDSLETQLLQAYHALVIGDSQEATLLAQQIVTANPDDIEARLLLASALEAQPDGSEQAASEYRWILARSPENTWVQERLDSLSSQALR